MYQPIIGQAYIQDSDVTDTFTLLGAEVTANGETTVDPSDLSFSASAGLDLGQLRLEGEVSRYNGEFDSLTIDNASVLGSTLNINISLPLDGDYYTTNFMGNAWLDINMDPASKFIPFVGGGLGLAQIDIDLDSIDGTAITYDEDDTVFAYQFGGGIGYQAADNTVVNLSYRYFGSSDPEFDDGTDRIEMEMRSHVFLLGIRQTF